MSQKRYSAEQSRQVSRRQALVLGGGMLLGLGMAGSLVACSPSGLLGSNTPAPSRPTPVPVPVAVLTGHTSPVTWLDWQPKSRILASLGARDGLRVWDIETGQTLAILPISTLLKPLPGEMLMLRDAAWSPDGQIIALALGSAKRGAIRVWEAGAETMLVQINTPTPVMYLSWAPDSKRLVTTSYGQLTIWNAQSGAALGNFQVENHGGLPCWSPDGSTIAVVTYSGAIALYDVAGQQVSSTYRGVGTGATDVLWSHKGERLAAVADMVFIYAPQQPGQTPPVSLNVGFSANALAWSPDDTHIAAARAGVTIMQVSDQSLVNTLGSKNSAEMSSVAWSPDGGRIAAGAVDGTIHLYATNML